MFANCHNEYAYFCSLSNEEKFLLIKEMADHLIDLESIHWSNKEPGYYWSCSGAKLGVEDEC